MFPHHPACTHAVRFYKDEAMLADAVGGYIAAALRAGGPGLVIARPALLQQLTIELHRQHVQGSPFGPERGQLVAMDAEATLAKICLQGIPDAALFREVIGGALASLADGGKHVAAYGEMVGVLCERGQYGEAVRLEAMWNELLREANVSLHCGYARKLFTSGEGKGFYEDLRAAHTVVLDDAGVTAAA